MYRRPDAGLHQHSSQRKRSDLPYNGVMSVWVQWGKPVLQRGGLGRIRGEGQGFGGGDGGEGGEMGAIRVIRLVSSVVLVWK